MKKNRSIPYLIAALAALSTVLVYLPVLKNEFVEWDDGQYVFENVHIRSFGTDFLKWAFSDYSVSYWHPLTWISHALDYAVWGLNPAGHHFTSVIIHAMNTFLVVFLVLRLIRAWKAAAARDENAFPSERSALIAAAVSGLLFGLHPLHVESVAWIAERKDLLCGLFYLLAMFFYVDYTNHVPAPADTGTRLPFSDRRYLAVLGSFIMALLSKPMAVTLPVTLLVLDWCPLNRIRSARTLRAAILEKIPLFVLSLSTAAVTVVAQQSLDAVSSMNEVSLTVRLLVASKSLALYLGKMVLPLNLSAFYAYPKDVSLLSTAFIIASLFVVVVTAVSLILVRKERAWSSFWAYYVVTLLPVLGIVQVGGQSMADRYTYLPSFGPFLLFGIAAAKTRAAAEKLKQRQVLNVASLILVVVFVALGYTTVERIADWKDSISLWTDVIEKEPDRVPVAYNNRGIAFAEMGMFDKATADFEKAIQLDPADYLGYTNLGKLYLNTGFPLKAIGYINRSIELAPSSPEPYNNRGIFFLYTGQYGRAAEDFSTAIGMKYDYAAAFYNRALAYGRAGDRSRALADYAAACGFGYENACTAVRESTGGPPVPHT